MNNNTFVIGNYYSRNDIYKILQVPKAKQGGIWNTGYAQYNGSYYIFANVNAIGRTGHNYPNRFTSKNDLEWYGKNGSHLLQPTIQQMLKEETNVYIFTRTKSDTPLFQYTGIGKAIEKYDVSPVKIIWSFSKPKLEQLLPEEIDESDNYPEGSKKQITVNAYERNPKARQKCIDYYGYKCTVCNFDFEKIYGIIGRNFIHVHHEIPLSEIDEEYEVDPIKDLKPVCPNCHSMLHRKKPLYSIKELKIIINKEHKNGEKKLW